LIGVEEDEHLLSLLTESDPVVAHFVLAALFCDDEGGKNRIVIAAPTWLQNAAKWLWHLPPSVRRFIQERPFNSSFQAMGRDLAEYANDPSKISPGDTAHLEAIFGKSLSDLRPSNIIGRYLKPSAGYANFQGAFEYLPDMINPRTGRWDVIQKLVNWLLRTGRQNIDDFPINGLGRGTMTLGQVRRIGAAGGQIQVTDPAAFQASVQGVSDVVHQLIGTSVAAKTWGNIIKGSLLSLLGGEALLGSHQNAEQMVPTPEDNFIPQGQGSFYLESAASSAPPTTGGNMSGSAAGTLNGGNPPMGPEWVSPGTGSVPVAAPSSNPYGGYAQGYGNLGFARPAPAAPQGYGGYGQGAGNLGFYQPPMPAYNWNNLTPERISEDQLGREVTAQEQTQGGQAQELAPQSIEDMLSPNAAQILAGVNIPDPMQLLDHLIPMIQKAGGVSTPALRAAVEQYTSQQLSGVMQILRAIGVTPPSFESLAGAEAENVRLAQQSVNPISIPAVDRIPIIGPAFQNAQQAVSGNTKGETPADSNLTDKFYNYDESNKSAVEMGLTAGMGWEQFKKYEQQLTASSVQHADIPKIMQAVVGTAQSLGWSVDQVFPLMLKLCRGNPNRVDQKILPVWNTLTKYAVENPELPVMQVAKLGINSGSAGGPEFLQAIQGLRMMMMGKTGDLDAGLGGTSPLEQAILAVSDPDSPFGEGLEKLERSKVEMLNTQWGFQMRFFEALAPYTIRRNKELERVFARWNQAIKGGAWQWIFPWLSAWTKATTLLSTLKDTLVSRNPSPEPFQGGHLGGGGRHSSTGKFRIVEAQSAPAPSPAPAPGSPGSPVPAPGAPPAPGTPPVSDPSVEPGTETTGVGTPMYESAVDFARQFPQLARADWYTAYQKFNISATTLIKQCESEWTQSQQLLGRFLQMSSGGTEAFQNPLMGAKIDSLMAPGVGGASLRVEGTQIEGRAKQAYSMFQQVRNILMQSQTIGLPSLIGAIDVDRRSYPTMQQYRDARNLAQQTFPAYFNGLLIAANEKLVQAEVFIYNAKGLRITGGATQDASQYYIEINRLMDKVHLSEGMGGVGMSPIWQKIDGLCKVVTRIHLGAVQQYQSELQGAMATNNDKLERFVQEMIQYHYRAAQQAFGMGQQVLAQMLGTSTQNVGLKSVTASRSARPAQLVRYASDVDVHKEVEDYWNALLPSEGDDPDYGDSLMHPEEHRDELTEAPKKSKFSPIRGRTKFALLSRSQGF
jgi:hypothetical protein